MSIRKLKDGSEVEELKEPIMLEIYTKCPTKWKLYDSETGQWYEGVNTQEKKKQWKKILVDSEKNRIFV